MPIEERQDDGGPLASSHLGEWFGSKSVTRGPTASSSEMCSIRESSEVDIQDAIGFALIQMKAETLDKIDAALQRLGEGTYCALP